MSYLVLRDNNKQKRINGILSKLKGTSIVYANTRRKCEEIARALEREGISAAYYHGGLANDKRSQIQQSWIENKTRVVVCTNAFGMGIDKPDVRFVAHLSLPKSIEAYYQETGRAGRDGGPANAWMAYGLQDVILLRQMMQQSDAAQSYKIISQQKLEAMLGLCELTSCRRQTILAYFDEHYEHACGNCDNCLHPPQTWDASEAAQKALSCVYRTGQRFGVTYIVDVLLGKKDQRIENNHHDQLTTFGLGSDLSVAQWRSLFRQLIAQNYIYADHDHYGALKLTEKSRPILRGESMLQARKLAKPVGKGKSSSGGKGKALKKQTSPEHQGLFDALRAHRKQLADTQGVPPYVIFHDATLVAIAEMRPSQLNDMQAISGIGENKLAKYGDEFLAIVKQHPTP